MDSAKKSFVLILMIVFVIIMYLALGGVSFMKVSTSNEYPLEKITDGEPPIYVTYRGDGCYYQYINKNGESSAGYMARENVKDNRLYIAENVVPRVRYNYTVRVYRFSYPGGYVDAKAEPEFDSVQFLIPEGTIAEF